MEIILPQTKALRTYANMLSYRRPANSQTEEGFIARFIDVHNAQKDDYGNRYIQIGISKVIWCCHTDTMHVQEGRQTVLRSHANISLPENSGNNCLGADCTTGVWLMLEMIKAEVPGLYIFHRSEERGMLGSSYIATHRAQILQQFKYAIAFDRHGTTSIITHQMGRRCCSEAFSKSIGAELRLKGVQGYVSDSTGVFTDTYQYMNIIPECTNVSVGFTGEHTTKETQNWEHLWNLRKAMISFEENSLLYQRDISSTEYLPSYSSKYNYSRLNEFNFPDYQQSIEDVLRNNPREVRKLLNGVGYTDEDIRYCLE